MTLEDLAECTAEVIEPIKYDFRKDAKDPGLTLWEVSFRRHSVKLTAVPAQWTGPYRAHCDGYH